ncbi:MAG TPA: hypothetical protein VGO61_03445 [Steroidobacteraceae bacterium]|jgi:hypothetical protein|nr:hypothetical protein [Steroidobacteraceae bacterium]
MPRTQRVALYIQRLAYENLFQHEEHDERPEDASPGVAAPILTYSAWKPTSFAEYRPFREPRKS